VNLTAIIFRNCSLRRPGPEFGRRVLSDIWKGWGNFAVLPGRRIFSRAPEMFLSCCNTCKLLRNDKQVCRQKLIRKPVQRLAQPR